MPKVITSQGLSDFIQSGKIEEVKADKPKTEEVKPLEVKKEEPIVNIGDKEPAKAQIKPVEPEKTEEDEGLEPEDKDLSEIIRKKIGKKHRAMKEAQEALAESERFAENQYNRARLAEQRAEEIEKNLKELQAKAQEPAPKPELKAPDVKEFTNDQGQIDWDKYTDAKADYAAKKAVAEERVRQAEEHAKAERAEIETKVKERVEATRKKHSDFDEVMRKADLPVPQHIQQYMVESEYIGDLGYYFAKNTSEFERISKMKPILAIAEIGKLESKLFNQPKAEVKELPKPSGAPAPIVPLQGGSTPIPTDPAKMDFKQLREYERQRARAKRH